MEAHIASGTQALQTGLRLHTAQDREQINACCNIRTTLAQLEHILHQLLQTCTAWLVIKSANTRH